MANIEKEDVPTLMQVAALSNLVTKMLGRQFLLMADPEDKARAWLSLAEFESDDMSFEGIPPEWSDFASQEYRDSAVRVILQARALATEKTYDPEEVRKRWRRDE